MNSLFQHCYLVLQAAVPCERGLLDALQSKELPSASLFHQENFRECTSAKRSVNGGRLVDRNRKSREKTTWEWFKQQVDAGCKAEGTSPAAPELGKAMQEMPQVFLIEKSLCLHSLSWSYIGVDKELQWN